MEENNIAYLSEGVIFIILIIFSLGVQYMVTDHIK